MIGARLVIARPDGHKDPAYLVQAINRNKITTLHFVPSMLQVFLEQPDVAQCTTLVRVIASGEALPAALARRFYVRLPQASLYNLYGPTETTVDVTAWTCNPDSPLTSVPIGKPIANTRAYILDDGGEPVPVGVPAVVDVIVAVNVTACPTVEGFRDDAIVAKVAAPLDCVATPETGIMNGLPGAFVVTNTLPPVVKPVLTSGVGENVMLMLHVTPGPIELGQLLVAE